jgi:quercetin dioxygenase-like cupin family protein
MKLKLINYRRVKALEAGEGAQGVKIRWLITKEDGAKNFAMRLFEIEPGGHTPLHTHKWEHEVFILEGRGKVMAGDENRMFKSGDAIFIPGNVEHQFKNTGDTVLKLLCLIPYM